VSGTDDASGSACANSSMICKPSRNQFSAAPVMKIDPSNA
jgi:hypothetical protein